MMPSFDADRPGDLCRASITPRPHREEPMMGSVDDLGRPTPIREPRTAHDQVLLPGEDVKFSSPADSSRRL